MLKPKGTMKNPVLCKGCKYLKLIGPGGRAVKDKIDMAAPPTGLEARCKAPRKLKRKCDNWTEDLDMVDKMFGMYDVAPNYPDCVNCVNFEGGDCPLVHKDEDGKYVPKKDPDACIKWRHKKYLEPGSDDLVAPEDAVVEGQARVVEDDD